MAPRKPSSPTNAGAARRRSSARHSGSISKQTSPTTSGLQGSSSRKSSAAVARRPSITAQAARRRSSARSSISKRRSPTYPPYSPSQKETSGWRRSSLRLSAIRRLSQRSPTSNSPALLRPISFRSPVSPPLPSPLSELASPVWNLYQTIKGAFAVLGGRRRPSGPISPLRSPVEPSQNACQMVRRAAGRGNLEQAVGWFLDQWTITELLGLVTRAHGESTEGALQRFGLRYLDEKEWEDLEAEKQQSLVAQMLLDELDLPGQRSSTALQHWKDIVALAKEIQGPAPVLEVAEDLEWDLHGIVDPGLFATVEQYLQDHGLRKLIQSFRETHLLASGNLFKDLMVFEGDDTLTAEPLEGEEEIAALIAALLQGIAIKTRLQPSEYFLKGSRPEWEEHQADDWSSIASDDNVPLQSEDADLSFASIVAASERAPCRWRRVFQRLQRHIDLFGLQHTLKTGYHVLSDKVRDELERDPEHAARDLGRLNHRFRPQDQVAAVLADAYVLATRRQRGVGPSGLLAQYQSATDNGMEMTPHFEGQIEDLLEQLEAVLEENLRLSTRLRASAPRLGDDRCVICGRVFGDGGEWKKHYTKHRMEVERYRQFQAKVAEITKQKDDGVFAKTSPPKAMEGKKDEDKVLSPTSAPKRKAIAEAKKEGSKAPSPTVSPKRVSSKTSAKGAASAKGGDGLGLRRLTRRRVLASVDIPAIPMPEDVIDMRSPPTSPESIARKSGKKQKGGKVTKPAPEGKAGGKGMKKR